MVIKVKYNGEWVKIPYLSVNEDSGVNYVEEAPKDGNQYTRKDGVWTVLNIPDDITETINNKVDKVDGKDLSTNDYTNTDKTKVDNLTSVLVDADIAQTEFAATITLDKIDLSTGTTSDVEIELPASTTVLSGLMTAADKTKLNSIAVGAEVNVNADWNSTGGDSQILNKPDLTKYNNLPTWVFDASNLTTEEGENYITVHGNKKNLQTGETSEIGSTIYVASSEHIGYMSPADKTILDGLAANAITSTEVDQKINSAIASVYKIKGTVANYEALPTTDVTIGDVYNLEDTGANYVATSTTPTWDKLSETVDLSAYSTTVQNDAKYQPKGNYLTSVPSEYVTDTELNNKNYATKTEIPTKVSQLTNDSKYLTTTPVATNSTIGGIMLGYSENNKNYAVKISSNKAYVTVPWVNTTYSNATTSAAGLMSSTDKRKLDGLNNYTLTQATGSALGGIKIGYTENGKNYPVELSDGKAFVNVPWTDTNTTYNNATSSTAGLMSAADKVKLNSIPSDVVEEAPIDDKQYARKNGEWVEVIAEDTHAMWVEFDENNSTTTLQRGGNLDVITSLTSKFKRCLALPQANGTAAIAYLNDTDSTKWPDGTTVSVSNGGQDYYMVHFPKYYYKSVNTDTNKWRLYISERKINDDYKEERECLIGVFEAYSMSGFRLASRPNVVSKGDIDITGFYELAQLSGSKWGLIDYRAHKTIANMFCAKYGSTNISTLNENIPCSGGKKTYDNVVGNTLSLGNADGLADSQTAGFKSSSFLGLEDCYYGKWEWVQGINIIDRLWIVYDGGLQVDTNAANLTSAGFTNVRTIGTAAATSNYITGISHGEYADIMPTKASGGSSTTYYADYYYQNSGNIVFARSGDLGTGIGCGVFTANCNFGSSHSYASFGSRLGFYGTIVEKTKDEFIALTPDYNG